MYISQKNMSSFSLTFLIILSALTLSNGQIDPNYNYDTFMVQFNRNYTGQQYLDHKEIFDKNYQMIQQRISNGEDLEVNDFMDWNETQLHFLLNYKKDQILASQGPLLSSATTKLQTPLTLDLRTKKVITSIKHQGQCGSCYSHAVTAQYQTLYAFLTGKLMDLAEQYLVECEQNSGGCQGGYVYHSAKLVQINGIPLQQSYPYKEDSGSYYTNAGRLICKQKNTIKLPRNINQVRKYTNITQQQIEQLLVQYGPLTVAVTTNTPSFLFVGPSGLINHCNKGKLDHAVLLVGYNQTHWIIKNSWGTNWGHQGFGYILKTNDCRMKEQIVAMQVDLSSNVTENKQNVTLLVYLRSRSKFGWGGNIVQLLQNNVSIAKFGEGFLYGHTQGPFNLSFNCHLQVVVNVIVRSSTVSFSELGLTVMDTSGVILFQQFPGNLNNLKPIDGKAKISQFCPTDSCYSMINQNIYYITLQDLMADSWENTVLSFSPPGSLQSFTMDEKRTFKGPIRVTYSQRVNQIKILVKRRGANWGQIRYRIQDHRHNIIAERNIFQPIIVNRVLTSFKNKRQDRSSQQKAQAYQPTEITPQIIPQAQHKDIPYQQPSSTQSPLILVIILLSIIASLFLLGFVYILIKFKRVANIKQQLMKQLSQYKIDSKQDSKTRNNKIANQQILQRTGHVLNEAFQERKQKRFEEIQIQ